MEIQSRILYGQERADLTGSKACFLLRWYMYVSFGGTKNLPQRNPVWFVLNANYVSSASNELVLVAASDTLNLFLFLPFFPSK